MTKCEVGVLKTDGTNCEVELSYAFEVAGAEPEIVHVNQLRSGERSLDEYGVLAIPGGFSYGDDIASGKILATELTSYLSDQLQSFVEAGKPVIGICNGFQVLVRTGLLPNGKLGDQRVTLAGNEVGRFECRWIDLAIGRSACKFVQPEHFEEEPIPMQTAHAEGRFIGSNEDIKKIAENDQVVFRYTNPIASGHTSYPNNPNGAVDDIAGICDPTGLVLGMMPHPERSVSAFHPNRIRTDSARSAAKIIFRNIVHYAEEM